MGDIDFLEHGGGAFCVRRAGQIIPLVDPRTKHYQWVLMALSLGYVPGWCDDTSTPYWVVDEVFERWRMAWDLPRFNDARRLAYLVDNYRASVSHDLITHAGLDLGTLWRDRRWTLLLDVIDRLPAHSWTNSSLSMDEDHAKMMAESIAARKEAGEEPKAAGPSLTGWTPEVAVLTNVLDAVRGVQHAVVAVQAPKGKAPEPPKPSPRPVTPLERALKNAENLRRKAAHESLAARVLRKKRPGEVLIDMPG